MSLSDLLASTVSSAPHVLLESMPRVTTSKFEILYYIIETVNKSQLWESILTILQIRSWKVPVNNPTIWFVSFYSQFTCFLGLHKLWKYYQYCFSEKHFVFFYCRSTAIEHKLRIFVHHYCEPKSQHCTIWADKSTCNISVANLLFEIENPFLFCMLKNFALVKNLQIYCKTKMSENFSCIIAVSQKNQHCTIWTNKCTCNVSAANCMSLFVV